MKLVLKQRILSWFDSFNIYDEDGNIYITYDRERAAFLGSMEQVYGQARELLIAKITENDIINGSIVTDGSYLKRVVFSLGRLDPSDGDPFLD